MKCRGCGKEQRATVQQGIEARAGHPAHLVSYEAIGLDESSTRIRSGGLRRNVLVMALEGSTSASEAGGESVW